MPGSIHYQNLVAIGARLVDVQAFWKSTIRDFTAEHSCSAKLRTFLARNRHHLEEARQWLTPDCRSVVGDKTFWTEETLNDYGHISDLGATIALAMQAELEDQNWEEGITFAINLLDLSNGMRRGTSIGELLHSSWVFSIAIANLRRVRRALPPGEALIRQLARIDQERESWAVLLEREVAWEKATNYHDSPPDGEESAKHFAWKTPEDRQEFLAMLQRMWAAPPEERHADRIWGDVQEDSLLRMLEIDLVLRYYRSIEGKYPETLSEFIPEPILSNQLGDPCTGKEFHYRRTDDDFEIWSPGWTHIDHGGTFGSMEDVDAGRADLCLDVWDYDSTSEDQEVSQAERSPS